MQGEENNCKHPLKAALAQHPYFFDFTQKKWCLTSGEKIKLTFIYLCPAAKATVGIFLDCLQSDPAFSPSFKKLTTTQEQDQDTHLDLSLSNAGRLPRHLNIAAHPKVKSELLWKEFAVFLLFSPSYLSPGVCWLQVSPPALWIVQALMQLCPYHESISSSVGFKERVTLLSPSKLDSSGGACPF